MATQVQLRRGTAAENNAFTGAQGEVTVDTTNDTLRVHDGSLAGGYEVITADASGNIDVTGTVTADENITIDTSSNTNGLTIQSTGNTYNAIIVDANRSGAGTAINQFAGRWNGTDVTDIRFLAGSDTTNKDDGEIAFYTSSAGTLQTRVLVANNGDISFYEDTGTTPKLFWDASAESLGIGTSSPSTKLDVIGGVGTGIRIGSNQNETGTIQFFNTTASSINSTISGNLEAGNNGGDIRFATKTTSGSLTERMRIDSSGNLLVGTTNNTFALEGIRARTGGNLVVTRDGNGPLALNRLTSDGEIANFYKDATLVGSIGSYSGDMQMGSGDTGVRFVPASDAMMPWNPSTNNAKDNAMDLGTSTQRFKDLYLSGGVYLGGTGADNYLEDYETGTWTPVLEGSTSAGTYTYDTARTLGTYTKIGNTVFLSGSLRVSSVTSAGTGDALISGLPFTPSITNQGSYPRRPHPVLFQGTGPTLSSSGLFASIENNVDYIGLRTQSTSTIAAVSVTDADAVDSIWAFSVVYKVS